MNLAYPLIFCLLAGCASQQAPDYTEAGQTAELRQECVAHHWRKGVTHINGTPVAIVCSDWANSRR